MPARVRRACMSGAIVLLLLACAAHPPAPPRIEVGAPLAPAPWTGLEPLEPPGGFRFVVVTDRTGGHRSGVFEQALAKVNLIQPAFVMSVGDLIEGYTRDPQQLEAQWGEVEGFVSQLQMPFFHVPGNHDYSNEVMADAWRRRFGPSYYHFVYRDVLFLVLNSELFSSVASPGEPVPGPDVQHEQMAFAKSVLERHAAARWTFVFLHQPLWDQGEVHPDWLAFEEMLGERPYSVFAGHLHRYTHEVRRDRRYITLATTGGRSRLRGLDRGEFDHVALVTMAPDGPVIANLLLDGIQREDVRTRAVRTRVSRLEQAVSALPLTGRGERFSSGTARFEVHNPLPEPLEVRAVLDGGRDLVPRESTLEAQIAGGGRHTFEVPLRAHGPIPYEVIAPGHVTWTLRAMRPDGSPLTVEEMSWLLPERPFPVSPAQRTPRIDGRLDDWPPLAFPLEPGPAAGPDAPQGASLRFDVARDDAFLYLALDATDPTPFHSAERKAGEQDAVVVEIDARPEPEREARESFFQALHSGSIRRLALVWLLPVEPAEAPGFEARLPALPEGTLRAVRRTSRGYQAELAIPVAFLDERQGEPWRSFRLNLSQQDFDSSGERQVTHWWRPSRFGLTGVGVIPGSGTFVRDPAQAGARRQPPRTQ